MSEIPHHLEGGFPQMTPCPSTGLIWVGNSSPVKVFQCTISLSGHQKTDAPTETTADPESDFPGQETEDPDEGYGKEIKDMIIESIFFDQYCLPLGGRGMGGCWPTDRSIYLIVAKDDHLRFECM